MQSPYFLTKDIFDFFPEIDNICSAYSEILNHLKLKISEQLIFWLGVYVFWVSFFSSDQF